MRRVAVLFDNFGPYHVARLTAAAKECDLLAIETARRSGEYAWDATPGQSGLHSECLFDGTSSKLDAALIPSRLDSVLCRFRPEVVVVPGWASRAPLASVSYCLRDHVPLVVMSESQAIDECRSAGKEFVKRQIVACFSAALVGGAPQAEYMVQLGMPRERVFLGYDAVGNGYFEEGAEESRKLKAESRNRYGLPERYFLASARFLEKKNLPRLIEAYALYRDKAESRKQKAEIWELVLLGDGPLREALNSQLSTLKLQSHVHMPGFKQYPDLPAYYGLASAFIHASTTEQWGLVVNEAMASGLPVLVSTRCGCAPDLVQEGVNGFSFDPYNVEELAQIMLKISEVGFPLSAFGDCSRRIISQWGPERFAAGLKAAVDCALVVGPKKASLLDRLLLRALLFR